MRCAKPGARRRTLMPSDTGSTVSMAICTIVGPTGMRMSALSPSRWVTDRFSSSGTQTTATAADSAVSVTASATSPRAW